MTDMRVKVAGVEFKNPVITASGTFGFGREYSEFYPLEQLGGITTKGITVEPRAGNPPARIAETPCGILNSVGLQNPGVERFLAEEAPRLSKLGAVVIANIAGSTQEDYCAVAEKLGAACDMIEMNISCPNVKEGGVAFGTNPATVEKITKAVKKYCKAPLIVKLSPNVTDIREVARAAEAGGADALSLINTLLGMRIDIDTAKPVLANTVGGLSGPAVFPVALRMVWQAAGSVNIPIIGMGGVSSPEDAYEMMLAGASLVSCGTVNFKNPFAARDIARGLKALAEARGVERIADIVGAVKV